MQFEKNEASTFPRQDHMAFMREHGATLQQIAERHGVTRERVRQCLIARDARNRKMLAGLINLARHLHLQRAKEAA
jgi:prolyl-tRNA editing enzyme YbaK/EbsC (Cys-tRNA(Pro) deacylase)